MKTKEQINEQLKRLREQGLTGTGCKSQDYWRGVREGLRWAKDPADEDTWLA